MAEKIDETALEMIARDFIANALGGPGSEVERIRERNLIAYNGEAVGEFAPVDIEDRSQYVASDVADTVDGMIPQILDVFVSDDRAVECEATKPGPDSEQIAKDVTGYLNHLFYVRNEGLNVLHDWIQDAALQKVGFVKLWAEEQSEDAKQTYEGQPVEVLAAMLQEGKTLEGEPKQDEKGLTFTIVDESRRVAIKVACVPPHQMRVDRTAKWGDEVAAIGEVRPKRKFELEQMGYDLSGIGGDYSSPDAEGVQRAMLGNTDDQDHGELHDSHKLYEYAELYFKLDVDGDGVAEWVQLCLVNGTLLNTEQTDGHPYVDMCLMPRSHAYFGDCPADRAYSIQKEQTNLSRALLDNVMFATNQRTYVNTDASVNIGDLLDNRPGGVVRGKGKPSDAFASIESMPIPQTAWQLQEYLSTRLEQRTGFTRYSQGMDADSLNKTATGIGIITQKADIRLRLMTRFAAQSVRKMFSKMLKLATKHLDREDWYQVNGQWHQVSPSEWRDQFNIKINVGLGHGTKQEQAQRVMAMVPLQQMGVQMGVVRPEHVANTIRLFASVNEFKNPDAFADEQPQGVPNPEQFKQMQAQVQQQMQQLGEENQQLKAQVADKSGDMQIKGAELQLKSRELDQKDQEMALKAQEGAARLQLDARGADRSDAETNIKGAQAQHSMAQDNGEAEAIAALQQQVAALTAAVSSLLTQQPSPDDGQGMDAPAAPIMEQPL